MRVWIGAAAAVSLLLEGCMGSAPRMSRSALIERIGGDAAAFNEAYAHAVNAQILLNILRSRDRQPRYYLSTTGISDAPSFLYGDNFSVGNLPLGDQRGQPWAFGALGAKREIASRPSYAVQPLDAKTLARAVFDPTPNNVFAHYWASGWPRDILLLVMVHKISLTRAGHTEEFTNEANDIRDDCRDGVNSTGCAYVRVMRNFIADIADRPPASAAGTKAKAVCGLIEAYAPRAPVREKDGAESCAPAFVVGDVIYRLDLRSFDDMVYYVGELMRASYTQAQAQGRPAGPMEARVNVAVAGLRGGGAGAPLFRILPAGAAGAGPGFAARVAYEGATYLAGPSIGRSCANAASAGLCRDDPAHGDRTSSVLSLLAELLALNQSPDSIRAPARLLAE